MERSIKSCARCFSNQVIKFGIVKGRQRYHCKDCRLNFTEHQFDASLDDYYQIRSFQLYLQGISLRSIEKILGVSRSVIARWLKKYIHEDMLTKRFKHMPTNRIIKSGEIVQFLTELQNDNILLLGLGNGKFLLSCGHAS